MSVQVQTNNTVANLVLFGHSAIKQGQTLKQDAGRSGALVYATLMAKISATQKWIAFVNEASTDGSNIPQGIYVGPDITEAAIIAGDVEDLNILIGAWVVVDQNLITIENSKALTTVIAVSTTDNRTVEDHLGDQGIYMQDTVEISATA